MFLCLPFPEHKVQSGYSHRDPDVPAHGPISRGEFVICFHVHIPRVVGISEGMANLRADCRYPGLEGSQYCARPAVPGELAIRITNQTYMRGMRDEVGSAPVQV